MLANKLICAFHTYVSPLRCCVLPLLLFRHIYHHMPFPLSSVNIWIHKKIVFFCANWNETKRYGNEYHTVNVSENESEKTDPIGKIAFHRSICVNSTRCELKIYHFLISLESLQLFFRSHRVGKSHKMFSPKLHHFISRMTKFRFEFTDFALVRWGCIGESK